MRDACLVTIAQVRRSVKDAEGKTTDLAVARTWKNLAELHGVEAVEDEELAEERRQRALAAILAEEGVADD